MFFNERVALPSNADHSPISSTFGFYLGKITGHVLTIGMTALYRGLEV